jgi:hypothetical protein
MELMYSTENYNDLIVVRDGYKQIDFARFLSKYLQRPVSLIDSSEIANQLRAKVGHEFGDIKKTYFLTYGDPESLDSRGMCENYVASVKLENVRFVKENSTQDTTIQLLVLKDRQIQRCVP